MKSYELVLQSVINKIEKEIDTICIEEIINYAGYSKYHFHRLFLAYTNENLAHFIKRLKMQKAVSKMEYESTNITQIALDAGYATHSAFCVAFKEMFGLNPTEFKKQNQKQTKEYKIITPEIITIEPIEVLAVRHIGAYNKCDKAWEKLMKFAYTEKFRNKKI